MSASGTVTDYFLRDFATKAEFLESLRPGERILVCPPGDLGQPPRALADAEATFVSFAPDPEKPLVWWAVVCGIPDGWADEENAGLGLRVIALWQIRDRISDDERVIRLQRRLVQMAEIAECEPRRRRGGNSRRRSPVASRVLDTDRAEGSTPSPSVIERELARK